MEQSDAARALGKIVNDKRKTLKSTLDDLADLVKRFMREEEQTVTKGAISKVEHGHRVPSMLCTVGLVAVLNAPEMLIVHPDCKKHVSAWINATERLITEGYYVEADSMSRGLIQVITHYDDMPNDIKAEAYRIRALSLASNPFRTNIMNYTSKDDYLKAMEGVAFDVIPLKERERSALAALNEAERLSEFGTISAYTRAKYYEQRARVFSICGNTDKAIEYLLRAETYLQTIIQDDESRDEWLQKVYLKLADSYMKVPDDKAVKAYLEKYKSITTTKDYHLGLHAYYLRRATMEANRLNYQEMRNSLEMAWAALRDHYELTGERQLYRASMNYFLHTWALNALEEYKAATEMVRRAVSTKHCIYDDYDFGEFREWYEYDRIELEHQIALGGTFEDLKERLMYYWNIRAEEMGVMGTIEELMARAHLNQGDIEKARYYFELGIQHQLLWCNSDDIAGFIRRAEHFLQQSLPEWRIKYVS